MNDGACKLLPLFMAKRALSYSAILELTGRLFTVFKTTRLQPLSEKYAVPIQTLKDKFQYGGARVHVSIPSPLIALSLCG